MIKVSSGGALSTPQCGLKITPDSDLKATTIFFKLLRNEQPATGQAYDVLIAPQDDSEPSV